MSEKNQQPNYPEAPAFQQKNAKDELKNQNPNQNHNTKKEALGPNTKR